MKSTPLRCESRWDLFWACEYSTAHYDQSLLGNNRKADA